MKLRAIVPDEPGNASIFWRIERPFSLLGMMGHDVEIIKNNDPMDRPDLFSDSICIIHRIIPAEPNKYIARLRKLGAKHIIYSIDDLVTDAQALGTYLVECGGLTSYAIQRLLDNVVNQNKIINLCDGLIVTTEELAWLALETVRVPITVLENALDVEWYVNSLSKTPLHIGYEDTVYIGYASGRRPKIDLEPMAKAWSLIGNAFPNVRFVVAGVQHDVIDRNINLDNKVRLGWQSLDKWGRSMQVDIGCCPLADTKFNKGKSPIKYYEYSMAGAAVVASNLVYQDVITEHVTGYIVQDNNEDEWFNYLAGLVQSKQTRQRIQRNAEQDVLWFKSLQKTISKWEYELESLL